MRQTLKKDPLTKDIPVIFLTCLITKGEEVKIGHTISGNFFIAKPYDPEELLAEIKRHLTWGTKKILKEVIFL